MLTPFSFKEVEDLVSKRLLTARKHPEYPKLAILNYTNRCTYQKAWNEMTTTCRGLIVDISEDPPTIVARPFPKFFNSNEAWAPKVSGEDKVACYDKLDGSLGILYFCEGRPYISTRGCFDSKQALHATDLYRNRYSDYKVPEGFTLLFEIIYPENKIVLDYGEMDDLVLIGAVCIETGKCFPPDSEFLGEWKGKVAQRIEYHTIREATRAPERENCEGLVVYLEESGEMLKIKQKSYMKLQKGPLKLTNKRLIALLSKGQSEEEILSPLPDEIQEEVKRRIESMDATFRAIYAELAEVAKGGNEKKFSKMTRRQQRAVEALKRDGNIDQGVWKMVSESLKKNNPYSRNRKETAPTHPEPEAERA